MTRRAILALTGTAPLLAQTVPVKLGIDLFSIRSSGWTPFQYLEPENLRKVREYAGERGIEIEIGMKSICPTSKMFEAKEGTAEEQLTRMIGSAKIVGSKIVR